MWFAHEMKRMHDDLVERGVVRLFSDRFLKIVDNVVQSGLRLDEFPVLRQRCVSVIGFPGRARLR